MTKVLTEIEICCWEHTVGVLASDNRVISFISSLRDISGIPVGHRRVTEPKPGFLLYIVPGNPAKLEFNPDLRSLVLQAKWSVLSNRTSTVTNLLGQLLSLACVDNGEYPVHSAAISSNGKAYLLIGGSGTGKTILSIALCSTLPVSWLSNDWLTIRVEDGKASVAHGYDLISLRRAGVDQVMRHLPTSVRIQINQDFSKTKEPWGKSSYFTSQDLELERGEIPCDVGGIFFVDIEQRQDSYCTRVPVSRATGILLRELFWPLRGLGSFVIDNSGRAIAPSVVMTPNEGWDAMCSVANTLARYPCYIVRTSLQVAESYVWSKINM